MGDEPGASAVSDRFERNFQIFGTIALIVFIVGSIAWGYLASSDSVDVGTDAPPNSLLLDSTKPPDVYTGELVDLDADGNADVALFGSPESPQVHELAGTFDPTALIVGLLSAAAVIVAAFLGPIASALNSKKSGSGDPPG